MKLIKYKNIDDYTFYFKSIKWGNIRYLFCFDIIKLKIQ